MPFATVTNTILINYGSQVNKPAGGFRLFYNPTVGDATVDAADPSIVITRNDRYVTDDLVNHRFTVPLASKLPQVQIAEAQASRTVTMAVAPLDLNGNVGNLGTPFNITVLAPVFAGTFTIANPA